MKIAPEQAGDPLRTALLSGSTQPTYSAATPGDNGPRHVYFTQEGIFAMSSSVVDGFLVLLDAPESDTTLAYAAIVDGILLDRCIAEEKPCGLTKEYLGKIYEDSQQQEVVAAYARLFRTLQVYHRQRRELCCGSQLCRYVYEPRLRADALKTIEEDFRGLDQGLNAVS